MPSIEIGPGGVRPVRAASSADARPVRHDSAPAPKPATVPVGADAVVRSPELDRGSPPVDADRVHEIRRAIEQGNYPVIPMRVADAMIAAGLLLRSRK